MPQLYVVSSYTPGCTPHHAWLDTLKAYCKYRGAELLLLPTARPKYKESSTDTLEEEYSDYLENRRLTLCANLEVRGDYLINPHSKNPLSGLVPLNSSMSSIYGGPVQAYQVIPGPRDMPRRVLVSTGSVTKPAMVSNASRNAAQYHTLGAIVVEVEDAYFFIRQLQALDDGRRVRDLDLELTSDNGGGYKVRTGCRAEGLVIGDVHFAGVDLEAMEATFSESTGQMALLKPRHCLLHDFIDFNAQNHHNRGDWMLGAKLARQDGRKVDTEYRQAAEWLGLIEDTYRSCQFALVDSNHNRALDRWMREYSPQQDPTNAETYFWLGARHFEHPDEDLTDLLLRKYAPELSTTTINANSPFYVGGYDCSQHGDRGANGARTGNWAKYAIPTIVGHSHVPSQLANHFSVGMMRTGDAGYNNGYSSWMPANVVVYEGLAASLLVMVPIDGGYRWRLRGK
jgi:hypothetical protein